MALVYIFAHTHILRRKRRGMRPGEIQSGEELMEALRATKWVPHMAGVGGVEIKGKRFSDGSFADALPYKKALQMAKKNEAEHEIPIVMLNNNIESMFDGFGKRVTRKIIGSVLNGLAGDENIGNIINKGQEQIMERLPELLRLAADGRIMLVFTNEAPGQYNNSKEGLQKNIAIGKQSIENEAGMQMLGTLMKEKKEQALKELEEKIIPFPITQNRGGKTQESIPEKKAA